MDNSLENDVRGIHVRDGIHFTRQGDGSVRVDTPATSFVVDPYSWASVVAQVSKDGEDAATYEHARDFHMEGKR